MGPAHMLTIRLQFEKISTQSKKDFVEQIGETAAEGAEAMRKEAVSGGEAMLNTITELQSAWKNFDWGHPIRSIRDVFSGLLSTIQDRLGVLGKIAFGILGALFAGFIAGFRQMVQAQGDLVKMYSMLADRSEQVMQMGVTMGQRVAKSLLEISDVALITGQSIGDVAKVYTQLGQARVPVTELKNLTQTAVLASKALGANVDQLSEMMSSMRVVGRVGPDQIKRIVTSFAAVQSAVGLTENEISGLIQTTTELTRYMGAFGAADKDIRNMAEAAAILTGVFGELGLGADRAGQIMTKLFDPTMIGENAMMIRQMGFSMQEYMDMLRGGEVDQRKLTEGLIEAAGEIQRMQDRGAHAMALQLRAQQMGFANVQEALRLAKEGPQIMEDIGKRMADADLAKQAAEGMASLGEVWNRVRNRFVAFFGKFAVPIIEKLTDVVAALEEWWLKNADAINEFADSLVKGIIDFIRNFDFNMVKDFLKTVFGFFKLLIEKGKTLLPIILAIGGAFAVFKALGPIIGMVGKFKDALGGLSKGLKGVGEAAKGGGALQGLKGVTGALQSFGKMAGAALIILALAGAVWIFADALEKLVKIVGDPNFTKALIVAVGALAIFVLGAIALMAAMAAGPQAAVMAAGAAIILAIAGAVWILSKALETTVKTLGMLGEMTEGLAALAEVANQPGFVKGLLKLGVAIGGFALAATGLIGPIRAGVFMALGKGLKELAIGMWVLGRTENFEKIPENLKELAGAIKTLAEGRFRGNVDKIGEGFKALTEGIKELTKLDVSKFKGIGTGMTDLSTGISEWLQAMKGGAATRVLGIGKDLSGLAQGFKDLSIGVWVLGQVVDKIPLIAANMGLLNKPIEELFKAMRAGGRGGEAGAEGFKSLAEGLKTLTGVGDVVDKLNMLPAAFTGINNALMGFSNVTMGGSDRKLIKFLQDLKNVGPVEVAVKAGDVEVDTKVRDVAGSNIQEQIQISFDLWGKNIVEAIEKLNTEQAERESAQWQKLHTIALNTGRGTR